MKKRIVAVVAILICSSFSLNADQSVVDGNFWKTLDELYKDVFMIGITHGLLEAEFTISADTGLEVKIPPASRRPALRESLLMMR